MMVPSWPDARSPCPRGPDEFSPTDGRARKGGANLCCHVVELAADLLFDGFWPVRVRQAGGSYGISRGTQCVRAHMADGDS